LLVERGLRAELERGAVRCFGITIALGREQHFAAPELDLVEVWRRWIAPHDLIERGERLLGLPGRFIGARELVEDLVVARIIRVRLEQRGVERDRLGSGQIDRRHLILHALEFACFEVQVAETTQRFGAQLRIGVLQLEEATVVLHRPRRARGHGCGLLHLDRARAQILDGGRRILRLRPVGRLRDRREHPHERKRTARHQARDSSHGASPPGGGATTGSGAFDSGAAASAAGGGLAARS
jgi:hypothetical protein